MNYSKQRELIHTTLKENVVHPSAEYIYKILKQKNPSISLATVYRNLNKLAEKGKIKKIAGLEGCDHFDHNTHEHYHILCVNCRKILDLPENIAPNIKTKVEESSKYQIVDHEIVFRGLCPECQKELA